MPPFRLTDRAIEQIAENRIRQAIEDGAFDDVPGMGEPLALLDEAYEPDWWLRRWIRRERMIEWARRRRRDRGECPRVVG